MGNKVVSDEVGSCREMSMKNLLTNPHIGNCQFPIRRTQSPSYASRPGSGQPSVLRGLPLLVASSGSTVWHPPAASASLRARLTSRHLPAGGWGECGWVGRLPLSFGDISILALLLSNWAGFRGQDTVHCCGEPFRKSWVPTLGLEVWRSKVNLFRSILLGHTRANPRHALRQ